MDWYGGPTVLEHLETVPVGHRPGRTSPSGCPVQYVIRPQTAEHPDYRGYAGQIASGVLRVGDEVDVLPSGPYDAPSPGSTAARGPLDEAVGRRSR